MAVKKATKEPTIEAVEVNTVVETENAIDTNETNETEIDVVEETESDVEVEELTVVEVEEPTNTDDVEVTVEEPTATNTKKFNGNVKIRMRVDHKCCIAMERYDLKEGKVYTVPENVKNILNRAGLLSPL